jgi:putative ABC transport system permease protein
MRMSMKAGRWFSDDDIRSRSSVFVVNEAMAKLYWPSSSPVGQPLTVTRASQARPDFGQPVTGTIIGVVADVHQRGQDVPPDVEVYVPFTFETWPWGSLMVRTRDGGRAIPALARAIGAVDPRLIGPGAAADRDFGAMESAIASNLEPRKLSTSLITGFAICAMILAAIGMYGVVAYSVSQRTQEIGVRKAIGATDRDIARLMLGESATIVAIGVVLGVAGAWAGGRLIRSLLFGTGVGDPVAYVATIFLLGAVALVATYLPTRTAMRLSPTIAMRND